MEFLQALMRNVDSDRGGRDELAKTMNANRKAGMTRCGAIREANNPSGPITATDTLRRSLYVQMSCGLRVLRLARSL